VEASATVGAGRQDGRILGVIGAGHFMSHFYFLSLPPLFPFLREDFSVSYTELGMMLTAMYGVAAVSQVPVGFLVDRFGARTVLTAGLIVMSLGFGLVGLAPSFLSAVALVMLAAIGHSVFHPADYAILNSSISQERMGRAFSIHTFSGHLGSAAAPGAMILLTAIVGWRGALLAAGLIGLLVMAALSTQWNTLSDDVLPKKIALLFSRPLLLFFLFFAAISMTSTGMQAFSVSALVTLHDMPVATASTALTVYLFCLAGGILLGGPLADRTARHDIVAGVVFVITIVLSLVLAWINLPALLLIALMLVLGLGQGVIRPARDMMLRAASPKGSVGKVFGFVSAGIAAGSAVAPIPFGYMLDAGRPEWVFYLMAIFLADPCRGARTTGKRRDLPGRRIRRCWRTLPPRAASWPTRTSSTPLVIFPCAIREARSAS
jgi:MFS family permease